MGMILLILLIILLIGGAGFVVSVHALWFVAIVLLILWLIGFIAKGGGRWYKW